MKLSDFGCSKRSEETCKHTLRGSIPWMAPEVMNERAYGRKADVWSLGSAGVREARLVLGCVFIEMVTAKPRLGQTSIESRRQGLGARCGTLWRRWSLWPRVRPGSHAGVSSARRPPR